MKVYKTREGYKATMKSSAIFYNVLIPCDYEELQRLRTIAAKYDRIKVNGNYPDKISKLKSRIKHLLEDTAKLRQLLKECRIAFETYAEEDESCGLSEECLYAKHLLIKINEVLNV